MSKQAMEDEMNRNIQRHKGSTNQESSGDQASRMIEPDIGEESEKTDHFKVKMAVMFKKLCKEKYLNSDTVATLSLPGLMDLIRSKDSQVYRPALRALLFISKDSCCEIEKVMNQDMACRLVYLMTGKDADVNSCVLSTVTNMISYRNYSMIGYFVTKDFLSHLTGYLLGDDAKSCKKALWAIWNISKGSIQHCCDLVDAEIVLPLLEVIKRQNDQYETAVWSLENLLAEICVKHNMNEHKNFAVYVCKTGVMHALCDFFSISGRYSFEIVAFMLDNLENISKVLCDFAEEELDDDITKAKEECLNRIKKLQSHENEIIKFREEKIVCAYFTKNSHVLAL